MSQAAVAYLGNAAGDAEVRFLWPPPMGEPGVDGRIFGRCPGGEEAVLKTVGSKGLAGSNPVPSASLVETRAIPLEAYDS